MSKEKYPRTDLCMELADVIEKGSLTYPIKCENVVFEMRYARGKHDILTWWAVGMMDATIICPAPDLHEFGKLLPATIFDTYHLVHYPKPDGLCITRYQTDHAVEWSSGKLPEIEARAAALLWLLKTYPNELKAHWEALKSKVS